MKKLILVGALLAAVIGTGAVFAQSSNGDPYTYTKSGSGEGFFRFDLPVGEYACRFISNYDDSDDGLPDGYVGATAWLRDENGDAWSEFEMDDTKFVTVTEPRSSASGGLDAWADQIWQAFGGLDLLGFKISISDSTPKVEIDLSRVFRSRGLRWTFQCVEFGWPE